MNAATLSIFRHLFSSVAEEMGVALGRAAYSANIKERLDFSCAVFLGDGRILAQAAHIPVHLGAMPASVQSVIEKCSPFSPGDVIILNDPYLGGTHLPDVTMVSPVYVQGRDEPGRSGLYDSRKVHDEADTFEKPHFFVASRAHHADIGGMTPGSMPISTELFQEGLIIPPVRLVQRGSRNNEVWQLVLRNVRTPAERQGDLAAQLAAHEVGERRLIDLALRYGLEECYRQAEQLIDYAKRMTSSAISLIPSGRYEFDDFLDDDGLGGDPVPIHVVVDVKESSMIFDFSGSSRAVAGNLNAVPAIVNSAVAYCLRCISLALLDDDLPMNQGAYEGWKVIVEPGSLFDPEPPHAVAAGNVETSQRIVDVVFGALAKALPDFVPAASQGTMNNLTFGSRSQIGISSSDIGDQHILTGDSNFAYYETIGGGAGANGQRAGGSGMHAHMSNTRNTPVEALEYQYPIRVSNYQIRGRSGGTGLQRGGDGLRRTIEFLVPASATIVSERRRIGPYGLNGGGRGKKGRNLLIRGEKKIALPGKARIDIEAGDQLQIETPGGGGWGPN